jgi:hypothetical protein
VCSVIDEAGKLSLGRVECEVRLIRAVFYSGLNQRDKAIADLDFILGSPLESTRGSPIEQEATRIRIIVLQSSIQEINEAIEGIGGAGGWYNSTHWFICPKG